MANKKIGDLKLQDLEAMSYEEKLAFYINAYNAFTLKAILEHYPVKSIRDIPGVWDRIKFKVAQRDLTLNHIEHQILRKEFRDPRVHFTLVCASKGCPKLREEPFNSNDIESMLEEETHKFINDESRNRLDKEKNVLYLSSIFKWFKKDFGDVRVFVTKYFDEDKIEFIKTKKPKIGYQYDWSINEKLY